MIYDFLVVGKGIAGLSFALKASEIGSVCIVSKASDQQSSSYHAQGGIAVAIGDHDFPKSHYEDTLIAGAGLCDKKAVEILCNEGLECIQDLIKMGMNFSRDTKNELLLNMEAGHSSHRILHVKDSTGKYLYNFFEQKVKEKNSITMMDSLFCIDLITEHIFDKKMSITSCYGSYTFNPSTNSVQKIMARYTILCSGGLSAVFSTSTNPSANTGDGIAMAYRAGCRIQNLEFIQFHPTAICMENKPTFLVTEALRGFGAKLKSPLDNKEFMVKYHKKKELAPRDIVSRSIDFEMKKNALDYVLLDCSSQNKQDIITKFPTIYQVLKEDYNINITKEAIPVKPAAHYTCGGVLVDLQGRTDIRNLYAIGEVASTRVHGANRLASNSLLEAITFSNRSIKDIKKCRQKNMDNSFFNKIPEWNNSKKKDIFHTNQLKHDKKELKKIMENYVGIVRSNKGLQIALRRIDIMYEQVKKIYHQYQPSLPLLEQRNLLLNAQLIIRSALKRKESRGLYYNIDYPSTKKRALNTILSPSIYNQHIKKRVKKN